MSRIRSISFAAGCALACSAQSLAQELPGARPDAQVVERRVNTYTENRQQDASLAADRHGNLLAVWGSRRQEGGTYGVFAQYMDPLGRPLGTEMRVNEFVPGHQMYPAAAFAADGSAWIAWCSVGQDGDGGGIYARRFLPSTGSAGPLRLRAAGPEQQVHETPSGDQQAPVVEANSAGEVLVCWMSATREGERVMGRRFAADGGALGPQVPMGSALPGQSERLPVLAPLSGGRFVAAWSLTGEDGRPRGIRARILGPGAAAGEPFAVHPEEAGQQVEPSLASDGRESFVVVWMARAEGVAAWTPRMRRFRGDGKALSDVLAPAIAGGGHRSGATVAMAPDGRFAVACNLSGEKLPDAGHRPVKTTDIFARRFEASGTPAEAPFRVNRSTDGEQTLQVGLNGRHAVWTGLDQLAFAWHGSIGGDARAVGLTLFAPADLRPPLPPHVEPLAAALDLTPEQVFPGGEAKPDWDASFVPEPWSPPLAPRGGSGGFRAFTQTGWVPPDPDLAVGPNHIVATVNQSIKFFTKDGIEQYSNTLNGSTGFFASVGAENFVFDPVALFDPMSQRFIVAAAEHDSAGNDLVDIAMSDDADPNGTWHKYRFDFSSFCDFIDFPNLGVGPDAVYMAADCFGGQGNWVHIFPKAPMMSGLPFTPTNVQTSLGIYSLGCVNNYDAASGTQYFAAGWNGRSIRFNAITDPLGTPTLQSKIVGVGTFKNPPDADQLGTTNKADTVDSRIKNGVYRNGRLWLAHTIGAGGQEFTARVRWYEFDMNGWPGNPLATPVEIQQGTLNYGPFEHNWFPDIHVDDQGNAVIAYNRSSPSQYIGIECVSRKAGDPPGVMGPPTELQRSTTPETGSRWGDYSGIDEDPARPGTFFSHTEYRTSSWRTWIGEFFTVKSLVLSQTLLIHGFPAGFTVEGAEPGETVIFLYSLSGTGGGPCVPTLGGLCLDLLQPVKVTGSAVADSAGVANLWVTVPSTAPLVTVWSQAVAQRGAGGADSAKSNVTEETIL